MGRIWYGFTLYRRPRAAVWRASPNDWRHLSEESRYLQNPSQARRWQRCFYVFIGQLTRSEISEDQVVFPMWIVAVGTGSSIRLRAPLATESTAAFCVPSPNVATSKINRLQVRMLTLALDSIKKNDNTACDAACGSTARPMAGRPIQGPRPCDGQPRNAMSPEKPCLGFAANRRRRKWPGSCIGQPAAEAVLPSFAFIMAIKGRSGNMNCFRMERRLRSSWPTTLASPSRNVPKTRSIRISELA
jgi:hypothetical protein